MVWSSKELQNEKISNSVSFSNKTIVNLHIVVRNNTERSHVSLAWFIPIVTSCKILEQYHNQDIDINTDIDTVKIEKISIWKDLSCFSSITRTVSFLPYFLFDLWSSLILNSRSLFLKKSDLTWWIFNLWGFQSHHIFTIFRQIELFKHSCQEVVVSSLVENGVEERWLQWQYQSIILSFEDKVWSYPGKVWCCKRLTWQAWVSKSHIPKKGLAFDWLLKHQF